jgi:peptidoglycan hydrolase-like protein with peptidoglycan-binding domain
MRKIAIALLATAVIGSPAIAASDNQQQPQPQQQSKTQNQPNDQAAQNDQQISPQNLSRGKVRQVQQALDKNGFKAGPTDGRWGRETENAVKQFQQSKQIQANGQLDQQTVADLGLDSSQFSQSGNQK